MKTIDTSDIFTIGVVLFGFTVAKYSLWMGAVALTLTVIWVLIQIVWRLKNWNK